MVPAPGSRSLQERMGYYFRDETLLRHALTHSSTGQGISNERLEFLGDRVLNLVVAELLYKAFPAEAEGMLAKRHSALVQGPTLSVVAQALALGDELILSDAERQTGGAQNENILSDAMEALLGAIYLDSGLAPAAVLIEKLWGEMLYTVSEIQNDPKTALQEWVQARGLALPLYEIVDKAGPDHAPVFTIEVRVDGQAPVRADGPSRRQAEKTAARTMLQQLKHNQKP